MKTINKQSVKDYAQRMLFKTIKTVGKTMTIRDVIEFTITLIETSLLYCFDNKEFDFKMKTIKYLSNEL